MQHQVHFGDLVRMRHAIFAEARFDAGKQAPRTVTVNDAIDDDVSNMDALRTEFASDTLRNHTKSCLRRREGREVGAPAQTSGSAGEDYRAGLACQHVRKYSLCQQETRKRVRAPVLLKHFWGNFEERRSAVTASVLNSDLQWRQRLSGGDKTGDITRVSHIPHFDTRSATNRGNTLCRLTQLVLIAPRDDH